MATYVKQGNIFGRIGSGIGKGLAEQLPKEIERNRLSSALKNLGEQEGLDPYQQFTGLVGAAHEYPQVIQSGADLLKQRQIRNAYRNTTPTKQNPNSNINEINKNNDRFGNVPTTPQDYVHEEKPLPRDISLEDVALSNPPAAKENPLEEKFIPPSPWSQERDEQAINEAFDRGIASNFGEARAYADRQKELFENAPEMYRKQLDYKRGIDKQVDDLFDSHLQTRLQKEGKETFNDIPGDLQLDIKKVARNAVSTGKMTPDQAAEYYSKKALNLAKDKNRVLEIANRDVFDRIQPKKKEENLKNLLHVGKSFADIGSSEYYYNLLKSDKITDEGIISKGRQEGMGLSTGRAAQVAYERSPKVKNLIKNTKISPKNNAESTRNFTENIFNEMTGNDSFLAIAREMKDRDPNFDEYAFFDYLRENRDKYVANKRLDTEISYGVSDFFPNWRDVGLFPWTGASAAND